MDAIIEFDPSVPPTVVVIELADDGSFRVRCSRAVDIETLLALNRDIAQQIANAALAYPDQPGPDRR